MRARETNDFRTAAVIAVEAVDLITDVPPAHEIVERMVRDAVCLLANASDRYLLEQPAPFTNAATPP